MKKLAIKIFFATLVNLVSNIANAQDQKYWIAIESHRDHDSAVRQAQVYSDDIPKTHAFQLTEGTYVIGAGSYNQLDAISIRQHLVAERTIPNESFVTVRDNFGTQVWPSPKNEGSIEIEAPNDEIVDEQMAKELTRKMAIQRVLKYFGDYSGNIDGVFGSGTVAAIATYQARNGFAATGKLTPAQQDYLFEHLRYELEKSGLLEIEDAEAGITIAMPADLLRFSHYDAPFAIYEPVEGESLRIFLISMKGNRSSLNVLHEILQLSGRIPTEPQSYLHQDSFVISSRVGESNSYTYAQLENGRIKGFSVAWHRRDDSFGREIVPKILSSFAELNEQTLEDHPVLIASAGEISELTLSVEEYKPTTTASGFFIDEHGSVATTADAVNDCQRVVVNPNQQMAIKSIYPEKNLAILSPLSALTPPTFARFQNRPPRLGSRVAVSGFSFEGDLGAPTLTYGKFSTNIGPSGNHDLGILKVQTMPGDIGGPVLNQSGTVVGMLLPKPKSDRVIPKNSQVSLDINAILHGIRESGIEVTLTGASREIDPVLLERRATEMTVLVQCF